jgi:enoyl-CoA hydratase
MSSTSCADSGQRTVRLQADGSVGTLLLDRPEKLNAMSPEFIEDLHAAILEIGDGEWRAVVVASAGGSAFSAGADLASMSRMSPLDARRFSARSQETMTLLEALPMPTIAAVDGFALGGGTELALACDVRIASERAQFGLPEVTLGVMPGAGGTERLPRVVGQAAARELIFTGRRVDAAEAYRLGLVSRVVPAGDAYDVAVAVARTIAENAPLAVRAAKAAVRRAGMADLAQGRLGLEATEFGLVFATDDAREGMQAFLDRRGRRFRGR